MNKPRFFVFIFVLILSICAGCEKDPVQVVKDSVFDIDKTESFEDKVNNYDYFKKTEWNPTNIQPIFLSK
nr:hypothetical protein [Desulfobacteraceae bacterium]